MKFGQVKSQEAVGGILAHSLTLANRKRLRKGVIIDEEIIAKLLENGTEHITVAMPEDGDVLEDIAATLIAEKISDPNLRIEEASTGRVNIFADKNGLLCVSREIIDQINAIDPAITIATLPHYAFANEGRLVATIKIIPYAVNEESLACVLELEIERAVSFHPFVSKCIGLISTILPGVKSSVIDKTRRNFVQRLVPSQSTLVEDVEVSHTQDAIADAIKAMCDKSEMIVIFGASAISDIADCIPAGIEQAGGKIIRFGMPVDPGNLMLLGKLGTVPVIGAPGCARSIAENGFDWVLNRMLADIEVTARDVGAMGVGGLLMETGSRPHPREAKPETSHCVRALVLAAGQSRRMGKQNKMTVEVNSKPMVRHVVEAVLASKLGAPFVVTGYKPDEVAKALHGLEFEQEINPNYAYGLSTSLAAGITKQDKDVSHVIVMLGDMPFVTAQMLNEMVDASRKHPSQIIVATHRGKRGNPVIWPRKFFEELASITGDIGARHIMVANQDNVVEVELGEAASLDLDTPEAVKNLTLK